MFSSASLIKLLPIDFPKSEIISDFFFSTFSFSSSSIILLSVSLYSVSLGFDFKTSLLRLHLRHIIYLDYYQINRHKKEKRSNRFSFFIRCSENGHFLDTFYFLQFSSISFVFIVH